MMRRSAHTKSRPFHSFSICTFQFTISIQIQCTLFNQYHDDQQKMIVIEMLGRVISPSGKALRYNRLVMISSCIAFFFPLKKDHKDNNRIKNKFVVLSCFCVRILSLVSSLPYVHDSQHWCLQTDLAVVAEIIFCFMRPSKKTQIEIRGKSNHAKTLTGEQKEERKRTKDSSENDQASMILSNASAMIYTQFIFFYTAAAFFKINEGFLSPKVSCAPIYIVQVLYLW